MPLKDWLPDLKGALNSFYEEKLKGNLESKNQEYRDLFTKHLQQWERTQKAFLVIALGIFLLLALSFFWKDPETSIQWKYLLLGLLTGSVSLYVLSLKPWEFNQKLLKE